VTTVPDGADAEGADVVVDARGRACPQPIIELARAAARVPVGGVVALLADDPAARTDVPAWCALRGQEYLGETAADDCPVYRVRRVS
jgi:TusA-related sulfurtransferase